MRRGTKLCEREDAGRCFSCGAEGATWTPKGRCYNIASLFFPPYRSHFSVEFFPLLLFPVRLHLKKKNKIKKKWQNIWIQTALQSAGLFYTCASGLNG